ncbi:MAG: signal peptidase II [Candidatus Kryptonium sp.]|nr:signal peptidase II [Candidatus Kryptonium sp.]MCX7761596.1 signal peptidase II [Candidatus Kryptonium sp.]MDW8108496.1 signal peptidase II [Candidatus Kryptonium sp.]
MKILFLSLFIVICDQLTKLLIRGFEIPSLGIKVKGMRIGESKQIIGDFLRITYTENPGIAFGINLGNKLYVTLLALVAVIVVFIYLYKVRNESLMLRLSLGMIIGGAIGNLTDRIFHGVIFNYEKLFHGRVIDFIDIDFFDINLFGYHIDRWPIFNIADASVTIGVLILLFSHHEKPAKEPVEETNPDTLKNTTNEG